jgi:hypothetical protein
MTKAEAGRFALAMGILAYAFGILKIVYPKVPDGSGRWGWLTLAIYESLGSYGLAALSALIGSVLVAAYFSSRR